MRTRARLLGWSTMSRRAPPSCRGWASDIPKVFSRSTPMRRLCLALLAVAVLSSPALAQRRLGSGGFGGGTLLTNKSVQEELKLTDEQKKQVEAVARRMDDLIIGEAKPVTLTTDQIKRYKQIRIQQQGFRAFSR